MKRQFEGAYPPDTQRYVEWADTERDEGGEVDTDIDKQVEGGTEMDWHCGKCGQTIEEGETYTIPIIARRQAGVPYRFPEGARPEHYAPSECQARS